MAEARPERSPIGYRMMWLMAISSLINVIVYKLTI